MMGPAERKLGAVGSTLASSRGSLEQGEVGEEGEEESGLHGHPLNSMLECIHEGEKKCF